MKNLPFYYIGGMFFSLVAAFIIAPLAFRHYEPNIIDFIISLAPGTALVSIASWRVNKQPQNKALLKLVFWGGLVTAVLTYFIGYVITTIVAELSVGTVFAVAMLEHWNPTPAKE